jgi:plastocyanin
MRTLVLAVAALAAGCGGSSYGGNDGGSPGACTATTSVSMNGLEFVPSCVKISPGATITFTNADSVAHTVTTDAGQPESFDSGTLSTGQDFVHTFASSPETVGIHCTLHAGMAATIFVE